MPQGPVWKNYLIFSGWLSAGAYRSAKVEGVVKMEVVLTVDGKDVEINHFVQSILGSTVIGAITTLHGVEDDCKEVVIKVKQ
jgi:hypothetical protein